MRAMIKEPGKKAVEKEIKDFKEMQAIVGGYIETVYMGADIIILLNEEGKLMGLAPNICFESDILVGNLIFVGDGGEDFESLTDEQVELIKTFL